MPMLVKLGRYEEGADTIEYLLTIAVITVAVVVGIALNAWGSFVQPLCTGARGAIAALPNMGAVAGPC